MHNVPASEIVPTLLVPSVPPPLRMVMVPPVAAESVPMRKLVARLEVLAACVKVPPPMTVPNVPAGALSVSEPLSAIVPLEAKDTLVGIVSDAFTGRLRVEAEPKVAVPRKLATPPGLISTVPVELTAAPLTNVAVAPAPLMTMCPRR